MPAPLVAAAAAKPTKEALQGVLKALQTDLYVRRQTRDVGTKKKPVLEESELHVNALGLLIVGVAALATAGVAAILSTTARDRTVSKGLVNPGQYQQPGWADSFNRTAAEAGWMREPGQLFYHRPKKEEG